MAGIFKIRRKTQNAIFDSKYVLYHNAIMHRTILWEMVIVISFPTEKHAPPALHGFKLKIIVIKQVVGPDCKKVSKRIENIEEIRPYFKLGYSS